MFIPRLFVSIFCVKSDLLAVPGRRESLFGVPSSVPTSYRGVRAPHGGGGHKTHRRSKSVAHQLMTEDKDSFAKPPKQGGNKQRA
ncbi:unnamed protein product [Boreogadus saida]